MPITESFDIVAFRSRQHALHFSQILKQEGYKTQLMSTPKEIALGCGLALRFSPYMTPRIIEIYKKNRKPIIGFYHVKRTGNYSELKRIPHD